MSRILAVVGATGTQGGGVAKAALSEPDSDVRVRAITRDPQSDAARALADRGAELAQADLDDVDSLSRAFDGVDAAFCVTNFWEHFSGEKELEQARNLARATQNADVPHVIWSTFHDTRQWLSVDDDRMPVLQESYNVPHFDVKGMANSDFDTSATTLLLTSFYWENLIYSGAGPQRGEDGTLALVMPMGESPLPGISGGDIGPCAWGIVKAGDRFRGQTVGICGESLPVSQMAEKLSRSLGEEVRYQDVPADVYRGFGFPGADEMGNMFQFKRDFSVVYDGERDAALARELHPGLQDFDAWLSRYAKEIPVG